MTNEETPEEAIEWFNSLVVAAGVSRDLIWQAAVKSLRVPVPATEREEGWNEALEALLTRMTEGA